MHSYESGRLDLPFVGHCTFGKRPPCLDWDALDADVAVLGVPNDMGTQFRPGARFGPRAIREASTLFSFGHGGAYDHEDDAVYLPMDQVRIVDVGDADIVHTDTAASHRNTELAVRKILERGAMPVVLGGDHAINIPCVRAFSEQPPIHIVQIDAHLDFVDVRHGVTEGHGNPMRRAAEQAHVTGLTQLGIRNVSSTAREGYEDARRRGSTIRSVRQCRKLGTEGVLALIPAERPLLRHHRHRRVRSVHRAGHRHAEPRRLPLLGGDGAAAGTGEARRNCRDRSRGSCAALRSVRGDGDPRGTSLAELPGLRLSRASSASSASITIAPGRGAGVEGSGTEEIVA